MSGLLRIPRPLNPTGRASTRRSLYHKYAMGVGALVTGVLVLSSIIHGYFYFLESQTALVQVQRAEARAAANRIGQFLEQVEREVGSVARSPRPSSAAGDELRYLDYLRLLRLDPAIAELAYLNPQGREQLRVSLAAPTEIESGREYPAIADFLATNQGRTFRSPAYFRRDSEPYMTIAMAETGPGAGIVVAQVNLTLIWDVVSQIHIGNAGYAYVTDLRGRLIAHPDLGLVLRNTDVSALWAARSQTGWLGIDAGQVTMGPDLSGRDVLTVSEQVRPAGWLVFVNQPLGEVQAPLYAAVWRTVLLVLLGLGLSLGVSLLLVRRLVEPIQTLEVSAAAIGAGHLEQRIEIRTGDELELLADAFNQMSAQLRESYASLEQKVAQRTHDLAQVVHQLEEQRQQLEIASRHKSEFLASMSHELRTPLTAILGFAEVLLDRASPERDPQETQYLTDILIAGRHLLALINDALDLARVEAGRTDLELRRFRLSETVESSLLWIRELALRRRIEVSLELDPRLGVVEADERKVRQVLVNLLSNAVKFTPDGGRIEVRARQVGEEAEVTVHDTGIGIAPDDLERIFEPFEQVRADTSQLMEGTGLGLAISRRFIDLHRGWLWAESTPGAGSTFSFVIPLRQSSQLLPQGAGWGEGVTPGSGTQDVFVTPAPVVAALPGLSQGERAGLPLKILVIDNNPMAIEVVEAELEDQGYEVIPALGGDEGIQLARAEQPALIILDLLMPDLDGFTVLERLRADPTTVLIPVIILTSKALSPEDRVRLTDQVTFVAQKGEFDRAAFIDLVHRHIRSTASLVGRGQG